MATYAKLRKWKRRAPTPVPGSTPCRTMKPVPVLSRGSKRPGSEKQGVRRKAEVHDRRVNLREHAASCHQSHAREDAPELSLAPLLIEHRGRMQTDATLCGIALPAITFC